MNIIHNRCPFSLQPQINFMLVGVKTDEEEERSNAAFTTYGKGFVQLQSSLADSPASH